MKIIGIDQAWQSERNTTGIAVGVLRDRHLFIDELHADIAGLDSIKSVIANHEDAAGIAVDAPLVITNETGQRACEKQLGRVYGARKACCHTSNRRLYPDAASKRLADALSAEGFAHLGKPGAEKWQIECYPHPALIEMFDLPERLLYKKGRVHQKRVGQMRLASFIRALATSSILGLTLDPALFFRLDSGEISALKGKSLKQNEDALDAIVCTCIGALYALDGKGHVFGEADEGYIYVPATSCV